MRAQEGPNYQLLPPSKPSEPWQWCARLDNMPRIWNTSIFAFWFYLKKHTDKDFIYYPAENSDWKPAQKEAGQQWRTAAEK